MGKRKTVEKRKAKVKRRPRGKIKNRLNDLSGAEWLYWTNTIWETSCPVDASHRLRKAHGAMKPPEAMAEIVRFFTKKGEFVLDPFAGVGGIVIGAELVERRALGYEVNPRWVEIYEEIRRSFAISEGSLVPLPGEGDAVRPLTADILRGCCTDLIRDLPDGSVDAIITDPPYGVQHSQRGFADETNFDMVCDDPRDFAAAQTFDEFYERMAAFGREIRRVLRADRYLVLTVGDRFHRGEYVPLGIRIADALRPVGFAFKGLKIWWNKATLRRLRPYAVHMSFAPNITHQNVIILKRL